MADRVMFISWGESVAGREARGLEVFNEVVGMYGRMQQEGSIESFDVVLLGAHAGLDGYMEVRGSAEQIAALRESDEFLQSMSDASLVVHQLRQVEGYTGAGIARVMSMYETSIAATPQHA